MDKFKLARWLAAGAILVGTCVYLLLAKPTSCHDVVVEDTVRPLCQQIQPTDARLLVPGIALLVLILPELARQLAHVSELSIGTVFSLKRRVDSAEGEAAQARAETRELASQMQMLLTSSATASTSLSNRQEHSASSVVNVLVPDVAGPHAQPQPARGSVEVATLNLLLNGCVLNSPTPPLTSFLLLLRRGSLLVPYSKISRGQYAARPKGALFQADTPGVMDVGAAAVEEREAREEVILLGKSEIQVVAVPVLDSAGGILGALVAGTHVDAALVGEFPRGELMAAHLKMCGEAIAHYLARHQPAQSLAIGSSGRGV